MSLFLEILQTPALPQAKIDLYKSQVQCLPCPSANHVQHTTMYCIGDTICILDETVHFSHHARPGDFLGEDYKACRC